MVEKTLAKIKSIEQQASALIKQAHDAAYLEAKHTREKHEQSLKNLADQQARERLELVTQAQAQARDEAAKVETETKEEISQLKKGVEPDLVKAKKEILRCLS